MNKRELARHERNRIKSSAIKMYVDEGISASKVAERFGYSTTTIYWILREEGVTRSRGGSGTRKGLTPDDLDRTIELYNSGLSTQQVGKLLGLSHSTVRYRLQRAGCPLRPRDLALRVRWQNK